MICQSSAANIRFETMKRLKKTSASKRFSLKNIHLLSYQETRWSQLADAEARQGESQSQSNLTLLVFSLNTANVFASSQKNYRSDSFPPVQFRGLVRKRDARR